MFYIVCVVMAIIYHKCKARLERSWFYNVQLEFFGKGNNVALNYDNTKATMAFLFDRRLRSVHNLKVI